MKKAIKLIVYILAGSLISCQKHLPRADYVHYVKDMHNGLHKKVVVGDWTYDIQYKPAEYMLLSEQLNATQWQQRRKELDGSACFNISFANKASGSSALRTAIDSKEDYDKRLSYFLTQAAGDIVLIYDKDTLHTQAYEFENNYNLAPQETMVVGFQLPHGEKYPSKDMQIVITDKVYGNGIIKATFSHSSVAHTPQPEL